MANFEDDGRPPFLKWLYCYISPVNRLISVKFGEQMRLLREKFYNSMTPSYIRKLCPSLFIHKMRCGRDHDGMKYRKVIIIKQH